LAAAKFYSNKTPITSADLLNGRMLPLLAEQGMGLLRILTDRGTESCGKAEMHDLPGGQRHRAHQEPSTSSADQWPLRAIPQDHLAGALPNGIQAQIYKSIDELPVDLDRCIAYYDSQRTHQGKLCCGRTPLQTLVAAKGCGTRK